MTNTNEKKGPGHGSGAKGPMTMKLQTTIELRLEVTEQELRAFCDVHRQLAEQGKCDGTGGMECRRVLAEWIVTGKPSDIDSFIRARSNHGMDRDHFDAQIDKGLGDLLQRLLPTLGVSVDLDSFVEAEKRIGANP